LRQPGARSGALEGRSRCGRRSDRHRSVRRPQSFHAGTQNQMTKRLILILVAAFSTAFAQTDSGSIRVYVADSSDAQIGNATVRLTNTATAVAVSRTTDTDGYATFAPVTGGSYRLDVEK